MPARLLLLGPPALERDGETLALAPERRSQLLAYLALKGTWVGRAELAALLWPQLSQAQAYANLRKTLFRMGSLPWPVEVHAQGGSLRYEAATDVAAFDVALREGRAVDALALRRGELLEGYDIDGNDGWGEWLRLERDRVRAAWRRAALERIASDLPAAERVALSARLLELDPLDEAALAAHLQALADDGQAGRARIAFRDYAQMLERELGVEPSAELQALHDRLSPTEAATASAPAPRPPAARDEEFVGRTVELRQLADLLANPDCRLVCITGPGGIGKTRLARQAMSELADAFRDGTAFVALEDSSSGQEAIVRLGRALGITLASRDDPMVTVLAALRSREALVVLDNFEHLAAEASLLSRLLDECPRLRIVVTSRVRLGIAREWTFPLEGLPCPEPEDQDRIEAFDAPRLFVRAARRVTPGLDAAREANAIASICRAVEGLPLALELAASWTRVLPCSAIAAELKRGTELLTAVDPSRPARHASVEVVFDHSLRLLKPAERTALARLSVFRGGFTPEAARPVAQASLPVLASLADKSLLRRDADRIHMHPLVGELAAHTFSGDPARAAAARDHAHYFLHRLAGLRRPVEDGDRDALQWVDLEIDNLRAAWNYAIAHRDRESIARAAWTLLHYFDHRGRVMRCLAIFREALASGIADDHPVLRATLQSASAHLEYRLDHYADAQASARATLELAKKAQDHDALLQCYKALGGSSYALGDLEGARRFYGLALSESPAETDPQNAAGMLDNLALVEKASGRYDEALRLSLESLVQHRRIGDRAGVALCLNNLGSLYVARGEPAAAIPHLEEGLAMCEHHGFGPTRVLMLTNLLDAYLFVGDRQTARRHGERALELAAAAGHRAVLADVRLTLAQMAIADGDLDAARASLAGGLEMAIAIARLPLQLRGLVVFAELLEAQGEREAARGMLGVAIAHPATTPPERRDATARLAAIGGGAGATPVTLGIDELVHRIVAESGLSHGPLIAALR